MKKILIFGGTAEGRELVEYLSREQVFHTVCVATEYGEEVLNHSDYTEVCRGRLDGSAMEALMREGGYCAVVDATHPYAVEVSKNVKAACGVTGLPYLRYLRQSGEEARTQNDDWPAGQNQMNEYESGMKQKQMNEYESGMKQNQSYSTESSRDYNQAAGHAYAGNLNPHIRVSSALEAARYLQTQQGNIFLTTGSKELHVFTEQISDRSRIFARVLPSPEVLESCKSLGLEGRQICAMQGPFSEEMNRAMLRAANASFLVTKDTGVTGGFPEKRRAAEALGIPMVIIRRPEEEGLSRDELLRALKKRIEEVAGVTSEPDGREAEVVTEKERELCAAQTVEAVNPHTAEESQNKNGFMRKISCIGIGMGTRATLTHEAADAIRSAQIVFGANRILESIRELLPQDQTGSNVEHTEIRGSGASVLEASRRVSGHSASEFPVLVPEYKGAAVAEYLTHHPEYQRIAVLMSGDVGFFSGARGIGEAFPQDEVRYYCGISSVVYFAAKAGTPWQDAKLLSAHGKAISLLNYVVRYEKIILLVSGAADVERIARELLEAGLGEVRMTVGTNLSYPEETITRGTPADFVKCRTTGLHILMVENDRANYVVTPGISDEEFVRGKVPMTKEEIRILSVAKLRLREDSVVYDVGAGTGSVAVECARLSPAGKVYAIEKNPEGVALIRENSRKLRVSNVIPVEGLAPGAMEELPPPTHAFLGGTSGNMGDIIDALRGKNPQVRIVINTIALESIAEVVKLLKQRNIADADIVQISAAKSRILGRYHMMTGLNPVYIISFGGASEEKQEDL